MMKKKLLFLAIVCFANVLRSQVSPGLAIDPECYNPAGGIYLNSINPKVEPSFNRNDLTSSEGIMAQITRLGNWQIVKANKNTSGAAFQIFSSNLDKTDINVDTAVPDTSHGLFLTIGSVGFYSGTFGKTGGYPVGGYTGANTLVPVSQTCERTGNVTTLVLNMSATTGGRTYLLKLTYTYTYPNKYITLKYDITIPTGNTAVVRLSHFWDTQLEGNDNAYGYFVGTLGTPGSKISAVNALCARQEIVYRSGQAWAGYYSAFFSAANSNAPGNILNKTVSTTNLVDNGLGISYDFGTAPGIYTSTNDVVFESNCTAPCAAPTFNSTSNGTYTCTTGFNLNSRITAPASPLVVRWYTAATGGTLVAAPTNVKTAGTYYAEIYDTNADCSSPRTTTGITVTGPSTTTTPSIDPVITQPSCSTNTGSVVLNNLPAVNTTIKVYEGTTLISTVTKAGTATTYTLTGLAAGKTYTFTATSGINCESAKSAPVTINAAPIVPTAPTAGTPTQPTCSTNTGSVQLTGLPASGTIIPNNGTSDLTAITITGTTQTVTGLVPGTYTFKVNNGSCTSTASSNSITINPALVVPTAPTAGTPTQPTCSTNTGSVQLTGLPATGTIIPNNGTSDLTAITITGTTQTVTGLAPGTYTFKVNNGSCTSTTSSNSITINAAPVCANIPTTASVVAGTAVSTNLATLLSPTGGYGAYFYSSGNSDASCTGGIGTQITPTFSGDTASYTAPSSPGNYWYCVKICDSASPTPQCTVKIIQFKIEVCFKPGLTTGTPSGYAKTGISQLSKHLSTNWPNNVPHSVLTIESLNKGMVVTRMANPETAIASPVEGMIVFDTDDNCMKLYTTALGWHCIQQSCKE